MHALSHLATLAVFLAATPARVVVHLVHVLLEAFLTRKIVETLAQVAHIAIPGPVRLVLKGHRQASRLRVLQRALQVRPAC